MNIWLDAAFWVGLAVIAAFISIRLGISVAMVEIVVGVIGGNFLGLHTTPWVDFLAGFGSILLTFLAGAEVDPQILKTKWKESFSIGILSFLLPFLLCFVYAYYIAGWNLRAAEIAGIALSTTSVAIVYAVMVETGLNETELGKIILAACFVTDLGTVLALGTLFARFNIWMLLFIAVMALVLFFMPKLTSLVLKHFGNRISQIEVKYLFFFLFLLGGISVKADSEAVLPAYLTGMILAGLFMNNKELLLRLRTSAFALLTPFFFLKAGLLISLKSLLAGFLLMLIFFTVKIIAKFIGVFPLTKVFRFKPREGMYTTLLMSTGLTFGSISAMFGLSHGIIDKGQYAILVTAVVTSGVIPTIIAQKFFKPKMEAKQMEE